LNFFFLMLLTGITSSAWASPAKISLRTQLKNQVDRLIEKQRQKLIENQKQISEIITSAEGLQAKEQFSLNNSRLEVLVRNRKHLRYQQEILYSLSHRIHSSYKGTDPTVFLREHLKQLSLNEALSENGNSEFVDLCRSTERALAHSETKTKNPMAFLEGHFDDHFASDDLSESSDIETSDYTNGAESYMAVPITKEQASDHLDRVQPLQVPHQTIIDVIPKPTLHSVQAVESDESL